HSISLGVPIELSATAVTPKDQARHHGRDHHGGGHINYRSLTIILPTRTKAFFLEDVRHMAVHKIIDDHLDHVHTIGNQQRKPMAVAVLALAEGQPSDRPAQSAWRNGSTVHC